MGHPVVTAARYMGQPVVNDAKYIWDTLLLKLQD